MRPHPTKLYYETLYTHVAPLGLIFGVDSVLYTCCSAGAAFADAEMPLSNKIVFMRHSILTHEAALNLSRCLRTVKQFTKVNLFLEPYETPPYHNIRTQKSQGLLLVVELARIQPRLI